MRESDEIETLIRFPLLINGLALISLLTESIKNPSVVNVVI